jgi:putative acetyltransferase
MLTITPIQPAQLSEARHVIFTSAWLIWHPDWTMEETIAFWEAEHELSDMDDIQCSYIDRGGIFLVLTEDDRVIGTGSFWRLEEGVCEFKRIYLLPEYQGQGLGYRMIRELAGRARQMKYHTVRLETDPIRQPRAIALYRRLGFVEIPHYGSDPDEISLKRELAGL